MFYRIVHKLAICLSLMAVITGCSRTTPSLPLLPTPEQTESLLSTPNPTQASIATPTPEPEEPRLLSICIGSEPESLYFYGNHSGAEFNIFQAIYDGPVDLKGYAASPVILDELPTQANGGARIESIQVNRGEMIVDATGKWVNLEEGVQYFPTGCTSPDCTQTYSGNTPVNMDSLVLTFRLLPGILWSDGTPLSASDSVFSFELAKSVYPAYRPEVVALTRQYQALDDLTIQWSGVPGSYGGPYQTRFFSPLPRQAWIGLNPDDLASAETSGRKPMGWGPYVIDQWVTGDHISLRKNPNYFRADEELPYFDELVFRFVSSSAEALDALRSGECDLADETTGLTTALDQILELEASGDLKTIIRNGTAWEQITFGITNIDPQKFSILASKDVRQALSMCIDRQALAAKAFSGKAQVIDSYVLPEHPLYNSEVKMAEYDPAQASEVLTAQGWIDHDNNAVTARISQGIANIPNGTELKFTYLTSSSEEQKQLAQLIQENLAQCGVQLELSFMETGELLAPGPEGPVFGRKFDIAQFAWTMTLEPSCALYLTREIPGYYPDFPKGWGGANAAGYSSPEFDQACQSALSSLPDSPEYADAHRQAQAVFADGLPSLPLYTHLMLVAMRTDVCAVEISSPLEFVLRGLENINRCPPEK